MILGREHAGDASTRPVGLEQQAARRSREAPAREIAPAVPALVLGIGSRAAGDVDVLQHPVVLIGLLGHAARSAISFLVSAIALAGLRPLGHTLAQFMIVWQR